MIRILTMALLVTILVPAAVFVMFASSSMTLGLIISAFVWIIASLSSGGNAYMLSRDDATSLINGILLLGLLTIHLVIASLVATNLDVARFLSSAGIVLVIWMGAHFASKLFLRVQVAELVGAADVALGSMLFIAVGAILGIPAIGPNTSGKPVIVFSEPSHFALAFLPILLFRVSVSKRMQQIGLICASLAMAVAMQSLTLVVGILFAAALMLRRGTLLIVILAIIPAVTVVDLTYYTNRLDFSPDSTNVSTLVFLAGWQNAYSAFTSTHGVGVGFQQFGIAGEIGTLSDRIADILGGTYINLRDGGSAAPKMIGELGIAGILLVVAYIWSVVKAFRYIRTAQLLPASQRDIRLLFFQSMVLTFSIELFVRGLGYFSTGGFLALASLMALHQLRRLSSAPAVHPDADVLLLP